MHSLSHFSERARNLIAELVSGFDNVGVVLSNRAPQPLCLAVRPRLIVLHPDQAGLWDLLLGAQLLRLRPRFRRPRFQFPSREQQVVRWCEECSAELKRRFANVGRLNGWYRHCADIGFREDRPLPEITWESVNWVPLDAEAMREGAQFHALPGFGGTNRNGAESDWEILLKQIREGRFPMMTLPEFPELPIAQIEGMIHTGNAPQAELERMEEAIRFRAEAGQELARCYRRKSEGLASQQHRRQRYETGIRLDRSRLVRAAMACRTGCPAQVFHRQSPHIDRHFDPTQHWVTVCFDLASIRSDQDQHVPRWSVHAVATLISVFESLGVNLSVVAFEERLIDLKRRRKMLIHSPVWVKRWQEPVDAQVWNRLACVDQMKHGDKGQLVSFPPMQLRTVRTAWERELPRDRTQYRTLIMTALRPFPRHDPEFGSDFYRRIAETVDRGLEQMHASFDGVRLDTDFLYLSTQVREQGREGGRVRNTHEL